MKQLARTLLVVGCLVGADCRERESPEVVRVRAQRDLLQGQIAELHQLIERAERGDLVRGDQIAIGIEDKVVMELVQASLPQQQEIPGGFLVSVEKAAAYFRAGQTIFMFQASLRRSGGGDATAQVELGGQLQTLSIVKGHLSGRVKPSHFVVLDAPGGDLGKNVIEDLARDHMAVFESALPTIEIPVTLEEEVKISGLKEGPVRAKPGRLPLKLQVAQVLPVSNRLWILIDASAGPWQPSEEPKS